VSDQKRITCYLVTRVGDEPAQALIWDTIEITVGRLETQDIVLSDPEVSREHAVFRRRGDCCSVEDLDTTLGVLVNETPVKQHELQPGDITRIGSLEIQFGQSEEPIRRGANVRYASELKGFALPSGADGGGTMLALSLDEDPLPTVSPVATPSAARAVSASGELEVMEKSEDLAPLDWEDQDPYFGDVASAPIPDLDTSAQPGMKPLAGMETQTKLRLVLELEGPYTSVQSIVSALVDKTIEIPPVKIRLSKPNPR
jgi:pSer/pThr/pTyr-binding forkhead associated (FHA) protein